MLRELEINEIKEEAKIQLNELEIEKITDMWRSLVTSQNFFLAFNDELEKQIFIKNTVEVGQ